MTKKLINDNYRWFGPSDLDGMSINEACEYLKEIEKELLEEGAFSIVFEGDNIPYEGEYLSINYQRYETDKEYEQRLKRDFDASEVKKVQDAIARGEFDKFGRDLVYEREETVVHKIKDFFKGIKE